MKMSNKKGFTLIELVIVIGIIGLLAAIAIPQFQDLTGLAKSGATKAGLGSVRSTLAIRYANSATGGGNATFPTVLGASDFAAAELPRNAINGTVGVTGLSATLNGTATNSSIGFWYISGTSTNTDWGKAGAYSDGTINTASY
jgi:prepilin-type N-terminal cleavage/methylation domain-containing protein